MKVAHSMSFYVRSKFRSGVIILPLWGLALVGCANLAVKPAEINPTDNIKGPGLFSGASGNILEGLKGKAGAEDGDGSTNLGVNTYLWRASLETLSFLPIKTADSVGGVIATDWYTDPNQSNVRLRANVLLLGKKLQASGLQVTLFKQTQGKGGAWADTPADAASARALEDTILTKARALRVRDQASQ
jgi:hypothetical protein